MAIVIKPKRNEISGAAPTTSHLVEGEIAVNTADQIIYIRDSSNNIISLANYSDVPPDLQDQLTALEAATAALLFPTGDYGALTSSALDAFGQPVDRNFDCLTSPSGTLAITDLGALT